MAIQRMDHIGIVVDDLPAAIAFFEELGLVAQGDGRVEGPWVERIIALQDVRVDFAMLRTPDGHGGLELVKFHSPAGPAGESREAANVPGLRHVCFAVDDVEGAVAALEGHGGELVGEVVAYGSSYRLCYLRGPAGIIVELAEAIG